VSLETNDELVMAEAISQRKRESLQSVQTHHGAWHTIVRMNMAHKGRSQRNDFLRCTLRFHVIQNRAFPVKRM